MSLKDACSVHFSRSVVFDSLLSHGLQHARPPCPSPTSRAYWNSCPLQQWCHPTISSSIVPFSSDFQSFPASGFFLMSQFFTSGGQSIKASALALVLPVNIQGWFPLGLTSLISLLSKGLSRVLSSTTILKHQVFDAQLSLRLTLTSVHDYWKDHSFDYADLCRQSNVSAFQYAVEVCHRFPSKEQVSFNFMAAVTIHSDFGVQEYKI